MLPWVTQIGCLGVGLGDPQISTNHVLHQVGALSPAATGAGMINIGRHRLMCTKWVTDTLYIQCVTTYMGAGAGVDMATTEVTVIQRSRCGVTHKHTHIHTYMYTHTHKYTQRSSYTLFSITQQKYT